MPIYRLPKDHNYSKVRNDLWTDKRISTNARFLLGFMLSLPNEWQFNLEWIGEQIGWNRDTVGKYVRELINGYYVHRERSRGENGRFGEYDYFVYEVPEINPRYPHNNDDNPAKKKPESVRSNEEISHSEVTGTGDNRTINTNSIKTNKKNVVVEEPARIIEYPSAIIETLSRHDLNVNAATLKRWLSLATEEVIVQVIEYAVNKADVVSVIGYITAILMQGYVRTMEGSPSVSKRYSERKERRQQARSDKLPDYVQRQIERQNEPAIASEITEDQRLEAARLLAALGEG